jgi:transketolase
MSVATEAAIDNRQPFAETLIDLAESDDRIVVVCNDSVGSSNLGGFQQLFPERLINVGIAEQNMVGVAAGLANAGFIPFVCAASPFLTGRALEQVKADVAYSGANVKLCGMSPGVAYGELGPTHHSIEDIAWLRAIDDLAIVIPADAEQTRAVVRWAAQTPGGVFLRISRFKVPPVSSPNAPVFEFGTATRLRDGSDLTIIASGILVSRALAAASDLAKQGVQARVVNMSTITPMDANEVHAAAVDTGAILTVEESVTRGGLGGAVAEIIVQDHPVPMRMLGIDTFAPTGSTEWLLDYFGLNVPGITRAAQELVARKGDVQR